MNVDSHKRTLGILHLIVGFFRLFILGGVTLFFSIFKPFIENEIIREEGADAIWIMDLVSSAFFSIIIIAVLITALPSIIGGLAVLKGKAYGMVLLLISGCISLLSFPLGTALGAYTIWVFVENNKAEKHEQIE
jgi:hypothetical protein